MGVHADRVLGAIDVVGHWIGGRYETGGRDRLTPIHDPAAGDLVRYIDEADAAIIERAAGAAQRGRAAWGAFSAHEKARALLDFQARLTRMGDHLAWLLVEETGRTLADARWEVGETLKIVEHAAGLPVRLEAEKGAPVRPGSAAHGRRCPVGVAAVVTSADLPLLVPTWMACTALACGNAVLAKPSEHAPTAFMDMAETFMECGFPAGALNVICGSEDASACLARHTGVAAMAYFGRPAGACRLAGFRRGNTFIEIKSRTRVVTAVGGVDEAALTAGVIDAITNRQRAFAPLLVLLPADQRGDRMVARIARALRDIPAALAPSASRREHVAASIDRLAGRGGRIVRPIAFEHAVERGGRLVPLLIDCVPATAAGEAGCRSGAVVPVVRYGAEREIAAILGTLGEVTVRAFAGNVPTATEMSCFRGTVARHPERHGREADDRRRPTADHALADTLARRTELVRGLTRTEAKIH